MVKKVCGCQSKRGCLIILELEELQPEQGHPEAMAPPEPPQDRVEFHYYDAGHMMYVRPDDLRKLSADIRAFISER